MTALPANHTASYHKLSTHYITYIRRKTPRAMITCVSVSPRIKTSEPHNLRSRSDTVRDMQRTTLLLLGLVLLVGYCAVGAHGFVSATAVVGMNNVAGWVRFYVFETNGTIEVNLVGLSGNVTWRIHEFPVDLTLDPADRCSRDNLGQVYDPGTLSGDLATTFGMINGDVVQFNTNSLTETIPLRGANSVVGRSLVVDEDGATISCATIRSKSEEVEDNEPRLQATDSITLQATFTSPIAGTVYFRQAGMEDVAIFGKLFWVDGVTQTTLNHNWRVFDELDFSNGSGSGVYRVGDCSGVVTRFDPTGANSSLPGYDTRCTTDLPGGCELGDLSGKLGQISVGERSIPYSGDAFFFSDTTFTNLNSLASIELLTLAIHGQGGVDDILACAPILRAERIEALQYPDVRNLKLYQNSPFENTTLSLGDTFFGSSAQILTAAWMTNGLCPIDDPIYNPFGVGSADTANLFTPDLFPVGDLSGKYILNPSNDLGLTELPVYGANTLLGRTFRAAMGGYRSCSALVPLKDDDAVLLQANFVEGPIRGAIYMIQRSDFNNAGVTNIIVDVYYTNSSMEVTTGHNWHVHLFPPQSGVECVDAIGPHFNPFNVDNTSAIYMSDCNRFSPLRCESGDLSNKHGQLEFSPLSPTRKTYTYIDPNLQLKGSFGILGRSIGLHLPTAEGGALFACAELVKMITQDVPDVMAAIPESELSDFDRVKFIKDLANGVGFAPANILLVREEVGMLRTEDGASCAVLEMKTTAATVGMANVYAGLIQTEVCSRYSSNACMSRLTDISTLCPVPESTEATTPSGAVPVLQRQGAGLLSLLFLVSVLLATSLLL